MDLHPYKFEPIYKERIWGGRNLERLFGRRLPHGKVGESWELADLNVGASVVSSGPEAGRKLTELTAALGAALLGGARPRPDGRFPLLLKFLDANEVLSLQVHPDARTAADIGGGAAPKTECWYVLESRDGFIYKGLLPGISREQFRRGVQDNTIERLVRRVEVEAGDFHYIPAGCVHALGPGVVVAEVQTPSDTTYRVTDWGRGREIHLEPSMRCIRFEPCPDAAPGAGGKTLLATEFFAVARRSAAGAAQALPERRCAAIMVLSGSAEIRHRGGVENAVPAGPGQTILVPAGLRDAVVAPAPRCDWLEITLQEN